MAYTPSIGIDQNEEEAFQDRYWGRLPSFIHFLPEAGICEVNPDYVMLVQNQLDGTLNKDNISQELLYEINDFIDLIPTPWKMTLKQGALFRVMGFDSATREACPRGLNMLNCVDSLHCNGLVSCI